MIYASEYFVIDLATLVTAFPTDGIERFDGKYFIFIHYIIGEENLQTAHVYFPIKADRDAEFVRFSNFVKAWQDEESKTREAKAEDTDEDYA